VTPRRPRRIAALLLCAGLGLACSAIPKAAAMRVEEPVSAPERSWTLAVRVSGGQDFEFRISDEQFEQALRDSLLETGMFARLLPPSEADYRLDVVLGDGCGLEGRDLTVLWSLSRVDTRQTVWQQLISSHGRSHHFVGVVRGRRGLEYAARDNIRKGLERLSRVDPTSRALPDAR
jgi:hypothetical protein